MSRVVAGIGNHGARFILFRVYSQQKALHVQGFLLAAKGSGATAEEGQRPITGGLIHLFEIGKCP